MIEFGDTLTFTDRKNDVLAIGELLIDMISDEYGDNFESGTYKRFFEGLRPTLP